jgi:PAS domain S-box-containing protein
MGTLLKDDVFTRFFEHSLDFLCILSIDGSFIRLNKAWHKSFGYNTQSFEGKQFIDYIHPDDIESTESILRDLLNGSEVKDFVNRFQKKDSSYCWLEWSMFLDNDKVFASARDVTYTKQLEDEYLHYETLESLSFGILYSKNHQIRWANSAFLEMFGCRMDEIKEKEISEFYNVEVEFNKIREEAYELFAAGKTYHTEIELTNFQGRKLWIGAAGKSILSDKPQDGVVWMVRDISNEKQNESEIRNLANLQQTILDTLTVGVSFVRNRVIEWSNKSHEKIFSYEPGELINMPTSVLYKNKDEFERVRNEGYAVLEKGGIYDPEIETVTKEGKNLWIRITGKAINKDKPQDGSIWMLEDITEQKLSAINLNMFKASIDKAMDGVYWMNKQGGFDYVNQRACEMLGYKKEELLKLRLSNIDPSYTIEQFYSDWEKYYSKRNVDWRQTETFHKRKDGKLIPVEVVSKHIYFEGKEFHIANVRDISERKKNEKNILQNQKMLAEAQRIANVGSWKLDLKTKLVTWSKQTYKIFGLKNYDKQITLDYFFSFVHPEDKQYVQEVLNGALVTKLLKNFECRIVRPDSKIINLLGEGEIILDEDANPLRIVGTVKDITDQKEAEIEIKK